MNTLHTYIHRLHNSDLGILFIRLGLGVVFINAGWMKIQNIDFVVTSFDSIGIPMLLAYIVSYGEFIAGILFILGIFVRYAGILVAIIMIVAIWKVHFVNGFSLANGGYEYNLVLLLGALALVVSGAGKYALSRFLKKETVEQNN